MDEPFIYSVLPVDCNTVPLIGRESEINRILAAIERFQNISIAGDSKIGKTSILKSIETLVQNDSRFENIIPVFIDLDKFSYDLNIDKLLDRILKKIFQANEILKNSYSDYALDKREEFSEIIEYCTRKKLTVLLLFDNFDSITVLNNLTEDFFTFLRGNAIEMGLSIITASRGKLETLCHKGQIAGSQFWNIFNPIINLSVFNDKKHANELLERGIKYDKNKELIISLVGVHPCFLKIAANALIENGLSDSDDESAIKNIVYEMVKPYYEKCLKLLLFDENCIDNGIHYKLEHISTLNSISSLKIKDTNGKREITHLKQLGYIHANEEGILEINSPLFERFLKEKFKKPLPYIGDKPYIFISYAHTDKKEVINILQKFMNDGFRFWFDEGIIPGNEWREEIADALKCAHLFLVIISPNSIVSSYVTKEINYAINKHIPILPVYLAATDLPGNIDLEIGPLQAIKKYEYEDEYSFFENLLKTIDIVCKD